MIDENNNKNSEEVRDIGLKPKRQSIFKKVIILLVIICCIGVLINLIKLSLIEHNDNIKTIEGYREDELDKGEWVVAEDEMDKPRCPVTTNLLPDGNVLIMGGLDKRADTAEIFDPNQMKIIKSIPLDDKRFSDYLATTLQNGNVYISNGNLFDDKLPKSTNTAKIFDAETYEFYYVKSTEFDLFKPRSFLLKNGHVLILPWSKMKIDVHQIYNPEKNEYYKADGDIPDGSSTFHFDFDNGDVMVSYFKKYLYKIKENKFEEYENIPTEQLNIQLDSESYLCIKPEINYSTGYIYNIKTKEKTLVKNNINKTWRSGVYPQIIRLENGNVLILGIETKTLEGECARISECIKIIKQHQKDDVFSAYIYDKEKNIFYEIPSPPCPVHAAGIVKLQNGDILVAGGKFGYFLKPSVSNKIQIYKYKH